MSYSGEERLLANAGHLRGSWLVKLFNMHSLRYCSVYKMWKGDTTSVGSQPYWHAEYQPSQL